MHIAYISYECPPDTAVGGIATYVYQAAKIMHAQGHNVEIFCASTYRTISEELEGIRIHRILCTDRKIFKQMILPVFEYSHAENKFDVVESPEFSGDGLEIKLKHPNIPLIVKLHTPWFLIDTINNSYLTTLAKIRFISSGLIRGRLYKRFWKLPDKEADPDYQITKLADQIHSPSVSLKDIVADKWTIQKDKIAIVPNPYIPDQKLLEIPVGTSTNTITYIGRLEVRKGLLAFGKAIKIVLKKRPDVKFRFVGAPHNSPKNDVNMKDYLLHTLLKEHEQSLEFLQVKAVAIPEIYAQTDVCVFPSIWENFPNVCLEAMSAGRGIVASRNGGMKDMLEDVNGGLLINPSKPREIANAIINLLDDRALRTEMGNNARRKIITSYNQHKIGMLLQQQYQMAVHESGNPSLS